MFVLQLRNLYRKQNPPFVSEWRALSSVTRGIVSRTKPTLFARVFLYQIKYVLFYTLFYYYHLIYNFLFVCECVVYACLCASFHTCVYVSRGQRWVMGVFLCQAPRGLLLNQELTVLRDFLACRTLGPTCFCSLAVYRHVSLWQTCVIVSGFYWGDGDLNWVPTLVQRALLPTEPSLQLLFTVFFQN